jgi:pimeloyl-ACP methyl ester carboxylesterase
MRVADIDVVIEGNPGESIVMIHGWPDTYRLWDAQVEALKHRYRCVRFTLPGFDLSQRGRAWSIDEVVDIIRTIVERTCPNERVTLLLHDWGCFYGYQFAMRHPHLVERMIGVDIGDAGSRKTREALSVRARLMVTGYQWWLALAWRIGGRIGDGMARWMARVFRAPAEPRMIGAQMGYPYAVVWFGVAGGVGRLRAFEPSVPMLFIYGQRKPFMFHSRDWAERLAARPGNRVLGFATGHWVMTAKPREFNEAVLAWLGERQQTSASRPSGEAAQASRLG